MSQAGRERFPPRVSFRRNDEFVNSAAGRLPRGKFACRIQVSRRRQLSSAGETVPLGEGVFFMQLIARLRDAMARFMYGRNGVDQLNIAMLWTSIGADLLATILMRQQNSIAYVGLVLYYGSVILWVLVLFRMFSRNLYKRQAENQKWLQARSRRRSAASAAKARRADKDHKYFTCRQCRAICRVPVGKGKVIITCPKCGAEIHGKT